MDPDQLAYLDIHCIHEFKSGFILFIKSFIYEISKVRDNLSSLCIICSLRKVKLSLDMYIMTIYLSLDIYQLLSVTLILTELFQHNLINVSYLTACCLYQVMMTLHFLNGAANDAESTQKSKITS